MKLQKTPIALAAISLVSLAAEAAPSVSFTSPQDGTTYSKTQNATCAASASGANRVVFSLISSSGVVKTVKTDSSSPFNCSFNPYHYVDGAWTLRAVASDSRGATATATRSIIINNNGTTTGGSTGGSSGGTSNTPPAVSFSKPANNSTVAAGSNLACEVSATDADGISKLEWMLDGKVVFTETSAPFNFCSINNIAAGSHTIGARATDRKGATSTAQVTVTATTSTGGGDTGGTTGAPVVSFSKPAANSSVAVGASVSCAASATDPDGIAKVEWLLDGKLINTEFGSPYDTCNVSGLTAGTHVITARATDRKGTVGQAQVTVTAGTSSGGDNTGGDTGGGSNTPPAVSFASPANNSTVAAGPVSCYVNASDADGIAKLEWFLDGRLINTEGGSPYDTCNVNLSGLTGAHVIKAKATDKLGAASEAQVTVNIGSTSGGGDSVGGGSEWPSTGSVDLADVKTRATADSLFSIQTNIYTDILGSSPWLSTISEDGRHGSVLPNGETLRFGKQADPLDSSRKAISMQLAPSDPTTGGSKRVELGFPRNIEYNKTYWLAVSVYVHDWGTLSTSDQSLFGFQLHNGTKIDLSPTIALYTAGNGRSMQIQTRYSTSTSPSQSNSVTQKWTAMPIPFGRWMDFVVKFRNNVSGQGFAQVWLDGNQIVNHQGNLGFNTPGYLDFVKWGYYNWTSAFASPRKVRLRNPTLVQDPTGSKYSASQLRSILNATSSSSAGTSGSTSTVSSGGVCSSASCVVAQ
jgi:hypothetical protein